MARRPLAGSERLTAPHVVDRGPADPAERLEVSVLLRRRDGEGMRGRVAALKAGDAHIGHLSREEFAARYAADPADVAAVTAFAGGFGLTVVASEPARRTVILSGTVAQFNAAFGVDLRNIEHPEGTWRGRTGVIELPEELHGVVEAVLGLDNRPQARPHFRVHPKAGPSAGSSATPTSFSPERIATLYGFPAGTGAGETVAIIELGGGYKPADLATYFAANGISPAPNVTAVSVDHGRNKPTGGADGPDGEVMLDIEVVGAVAPGADIVVYFAPNTDAGFLDAVTTAVHDTTHKPSVVSISWGGPESTWTSQSQTAFDQAFQAAAVMGVTITVASGDNGSSDGETDGADHVDFPASSPHALACGGTSIVAQGDKIASETVWNDGSGGGAGGGGISTVFAVPSFQEGLTATRTGAAPAALSNRGVPDVSGDADPQTGYAVRIDGTDTVIGGTSAVAPLWAGLIARINAARGAPVGFVNPALYAAAASGASPCNDILTGNNGDFEATPGWDACTGLGSPNGPAVAAALAAMAEGPTS
jgi:kumamolisin